MKILGLSGSLRAASVNSMLLRAIARLAPDDINVSIFTGLGELPLFNPDLDARLLVSVVAFHRAIAAADTVLFASPEYAHGVTGTVKNALDWLVGFEPFANKIVAVLNTSPRAHHADEALRETLRTMAAVIVESASISIPLLGSGLDEASMTATPAIAGAIRESLWALKQAVESYHVPLTAEFPIS
jgi:chromate reductase